MREPRDPGPRRRGLRRRPPGRALLPRRARDDALRGHLADPEAHHRPRADRHQRAHARACLVGVVGAGTMGAGIAQLGAAGRGDAPARPGPAACERDRDRSGSGSRAGEKGRPQPARRGIAGAGRALDDLAGCDARHRGGARAARAQARAVRAARRDRARRRVLATNTSSIPSPSSPPARPTPERVVGMHFFNPAPVMRLVEVVAGESSRRGRARSRARARRGDGQARDRRRRRPGLPRQPLQPAVRLEALRLRAGAPRDRRDRSTASAASAAASGWARSS